MATGIAELEKIVAKIGISMNKLAESQKELAVSQKGTDKTIKELAASQKGLADSQKKTELALQKTQDVLQETLLELNSNVGRVNRRLGEIVELVVVPGLMTGMNRLGHKFTISSPQKKFSKDGKQLAEVDLMLENCAEVMVVEVKARFKLGDMNEFLRKLERLRKNEKITGVAEKTIYAAAASMRFDPEACKIAVKNGIYVVGINTDFDDEKLTISPPAKGTAGKW